jgi:hypothetical protein
LRLIDAAVDQYAVENNRSSGATITIDQWTSYLKQGTALYNTGQDLFGNDYGAQTVDSLPKVRLSTWNTLSDVAGADFFPPYTHY